MKRKSKKLSDFKKKLTKSVFLYGEPNVEKRTTLKSIQETYTNEVNRFIRLIHEEESLLPAVIKHARTSPEARAFEKANRVNLTSGYIQSAFDMAMDHLSNFVRGMLTEKLMTELNWHGYSYILVEPAYTSQTCPVCGNVDSKNRDGKHFACTCCGYEDDADHVGALNIKERGNDKKIADIFTSFKYAVKKRYEAVKDILIERHNDWWATNMKGCYI